MPYSKGKRANEQKLIRKTFHGISDLLTRDAMAKNNLPPGTQRRYEILTDFGKELYFKGSICGYTYDDFISDISFVSGNRVNSEDAGSSKNSLDRWVDFTKKFCDFDNVPTARMMEEVVSREELKSLIKGGYNFAESNPNEGLLYFGKELFYRGSEKNYTIDDFISDIVISFSPTAKKRNETAYSGFCRGFTGYLFFPTCEQITQMRKNSKILEIVYNGYLWASQHNDDDNKKRYVKDALNIRRRT